MLSIHLLQRRDHYHQYQHSILHLSVWCHPIAASVGHPFIAKRSKNTTIANIMVEGVKDDLQIVISTAME
jgi:hypothetical protein